MATPRLSDIIVQYDGSADFAEWVKKMELVAKLQKIEELENFLPLFLVGDAFAVYDALDAHAKSDYGFLKASLLKAFSLNCFTAYECLQNRRYRPGESVDVYLADLRRLIGLIGNTDEVLKCAFVSGLPGDMKTQLKAASALESMSVADVAERARTLDLKNMTVPDPNAISAAASSKVRRDLPQKRNCHRCGEPGHIARFCPSKSTNRVCFLCGEEGHFVAQCPKKNASKNE